MTAAKQDLSRQLKGAHMSGGAGLCGVLRRAVHAFGAAVAEDVMTAAIYRRGREIGRRFAAYGASDLAGLRDAFLDLVLDQRPRCLLEIGASPIDLA